MNKKTVALLGLLSCAHTILTMEVESPLGSPVHSPKKPFAQSPTKKRAASESPKLQRPAKRLRFSFELEEDKTNKENLPTAYILNVTSRIPITKKLSDLSKLITSMLEKEGYDDDDSDSNNQPVFDIAKLLPEKNFSQAGVTAFVDLWHQFSTTTITPATIHALSFTMFRECIHLANFFGIEELFKALMKETIIMLKKYKNSDDLRSLQSENLFIIASQSQELRHELERSLLPITLTLYERNVSPETYNAFFSPQGSFLITKIIDPSNYARYVKIIDLHNNYQSQLIMDEAVDIAITPDEKYLILVGSDKTISMYKRGNTTRNYAFNNNLGGYYSQISIDPSGKFLVGITIDNKKNLWSIEENFKFIKPNELNDHHKTIIAQQDLTNQHDESPITPGETVIALSPDESIAVTTRTKPQASTRVWDILGTKKILVTLLAMTTAALIDPRNQYILIKNSSLTYTLLGTNLTSASLKTLVLLALLADAKSKNEPFIVPVWLMAEFQALETTLKDYFKNTALVVP